MWCHSCLRMTEYVVYISDYHPCVWNSVFFWIVYPPVSLNAEKILALLILNPVKVCLLCWCLYPLWAAKLLLSLSHPEFWLSLLIRGQLYASNTCLYYQAKFETLEMNVPWVMAWGWKSKSNPHLSRNCAGNKAKKMLGTNIWILSFKV